MTPRKNKADKVKPSNITGDLQIKLFLFALLFALYFTFTNVIETEQLYPKNEKWFDYSIWQHHAQRECFEIQPNWLFFNGDEKRFHVTTNVKKTCNFTNVPIIWFTVTDMDSCNIQNETNLSLRTQINLSGGKVKLEINSDRMIINQTYRLILAFKLTDDFYNYFRLTTDGSSLYKIAILNKKGLKGYYCEGNCYTVLQGEVIPNEEDNDPISLSKTFTFANGEDQSVIKFVPKSRYWFTLQKVLDALILGSMSVIIYKIFFENSQANRNNNL